MDRRVVQTSGFDGQQNLIDHRLTAVSAECCNGDSGFHAAYETSSDFPVWGVLQEGSSLSVSVQSCKILQQDVSFGRWSSITRSSCLVHCLNRCNICCGDWTGWLLQKQNWRTTSSPQVLTSCSFSSLQFSSNCRSSMVPCPSCTSSWLGSISLAKYLPRFRLSANLKAFLKKKSERPDKPLIAVCFLLSSSYLKVPEFMCIKICDASLLGHSSRIFASVTCHAAVSCRGMRAAVL